MKKLMTMIATVATAFGLFAADTPDPNTYYSTSFEASDAGCDGGTTFDWSNAGWTTDCTDEFKLADHADELLPYADGRVRRDEFFSAKDTNNKYLMLATGTNEIKHEIGGADRVFFDQLVKFTGFEEAPVVADGTKIAVWLSATETDESTVGATNLYVTAGTGTTATNLQIAADVAVDTWYRLTIKSLGNVVEESLGQQVGFLVYINGQLATIVEGQQDYHVNSTKLLAPADGFYAKGQLFTAIDTTTAALTSVGYAGIGGVDDIIFSKDAPDFAASVNVTVAEITGARIEVKDSEDNVITLTSGGYYTLPRGAFTVTYTAAPNYILPGAPIVKNYNTEEKTEVDDSETVKPQEVVVEVKYNLGTAAKYADEQEALAAVEAYTRNPENYGRQVDIEFVKAVTKTAYAFGEGTIITITDNSGDVEPGDQVTSIWSITKGNVSQLTGIGNYKAVYFDYDFEAEAPSEYTLTFAGALGESSSIAAEKITAEADSITLDPNSSILTKSNLEGAFKAVAGYELKFITDETGWMTYYLEESAPTRKFSGGEGTEAAPYILAKDADFDELKADVDGGEAYADTFFKLGDNVTLQDWEGIGVNDQQDNDDSLNRRPFKGVFNGNGKTLTVSFAGSKKYMGFFNYLTDGAVVSNMTFDVSLGTIKTEGEFGFAAVVGEATGATIENVTVNGTVGTQAIPVKHNGAGIAVYCSNVAGNGVLFKDCVNNASVYTQAGKAAGFLSNANGEGDVVFVNCVNNGAVTALKDDGNNGIGGFIGFDGAGGARNFSNCTNTGAMTATGIGVGSFVGFVNSNSYATSIEGNTAQADIPAIGTHAGTSGGVGFRFATVDGTTATFVADATLALNGSYKVMAPNATPTFEFTCAGTIAFDEELVAVKNFNGITAVAPLEVTSKKEGTVTTFTAAVPIPTFDITIAETVNGKLETSVTNDVEAGTVVTVTATPDTGYELDTITTNDQVLVGKTFEMPAENVTVAATFKKAGPVYPPEWPETDPETKAKYVTWATTYAEQMKGLDKQVLEEAFLLNCDPTTLAAEKAAFKITKIEKVEGEWVVTVKSTNIAGEAFNVAVTVKAFSEVGCTTVVPTPAGTETKLFWKAFLDFPAAK